MRFFIVALLLFVPVAVFAADFVPLAPLPNLDTRGSVTLESYINSLFLLIVSVAAMLAVIRIVIGGFQYMTQTQSTSATSNARLVIRDAVVGLILLLSVYLILSVVNPHILDLSALKFSNLSASKEVEAQIEKNRDDALALAEERRKKFEAFATETPYLYGNNKQGNELDLTGVSQGAKNAAISSCTNNGGSVYQGVQRSCEKSDGTVVSKGRFIDNNGGVPFFSAITDPIIVNVAASCGVGETYVDGSKKDILYCIH